MKKKTKNNKLTNEKFHDILRVKEADFLKTNLSILHCRSKNKIVYCNLSNTPYPELFFHICIEIDDYRVVFSITINKRIFCYLYKSNGRILLESIIENC